MPERRGPARVTAWMMSRPRARIALVLLVPFVVALAAVGLALRALPGGVEDSGAPTAEPTLLFAEFHSTADIVYAAPASDPERRTLVARVEHAEGWGINPAPAMAGTLVAYTVLPAGSPGRRDARAELWVLDVQTRTRTRLARDADLLVAPLLDRAGGYLSYRSTGPSGEQRLVRVDLRTRARRVLHTYDGAFGVYPVGFASDGALLFAQLSNSGTDVYRVRDGQVPELLFHASDNIARDWQLSPDGQRLSYLAPEVVAERVVHRLRVVELVAGAVHGVAADAAAVEQFAPVWTPAGDGVTVGREAYPAANAAAVTLWLGGGRATSLAAPERGFDAPLGWSPDGRYLAARSFDGPGSFEPGRESMVVISTDRVRRAVTSRAEVIFLGWLTSG